MGMPCGSTLMSAAACEPHLKCVEAELGRMTGRTSMPSTWLGCHCKLHSLRSGQVRCGKVGVAVVVSNVTRCDHACHSVNKGGQLRKLLEDRGALVASMCRGYSANEARQVVQVSMRFLLLDVQGVLEQAWWQAVFPADDGERYQVKDNGNCLKDSEQCMTAVSCRRYWRGNVQRLRRMAWMHPRPLLS
eukprot:6209942-Amphidinium_carterae.3